MKVEQIMTLTHDLIIMSPDRHADKALKRMYQENKGRVFVCIGSPPKLIGIISKTDILNIATERQEYEREVKRSSATSNFNKQG
jgi:predicted transcriptional regulator